MLSNFLNGVIRFSLQQRVLVVALAMLLLACGVPPDMAMMRNILPRTSDSRQILQFLTTSR